MDELNAMCPYRGWSSFAKREKRFVIALFVTCMLAVVACAGIDVAGFTTSMVNKQSVANLETAHDVMERELKLLEKKILNNEENIKTLKHELVWP